MFDSSLTVVLVFGGLAVTSSSHGVIDGVQLVASPLDILVVGHYLNAQCVDMSWSL